MRKCMFCGKLTDHVMCDSCVNNDIQTQEMIESKMLYDSLMDQEVEDQS